MVPRISWTGYRPLSPDLVSTIPESSTHSVDDVAMTDGW